MMQTVNEGDKPLVWLHGEVRTPPLSQHARVETGVLLRRMQQSESLGMPVSRAMPSIGKRCHELRIVDEDSIWRVVYRIDDDAIARRDRGLPTATPPVRRDRRRKGVN